MKEALSILMPFWEELGRGRAFFLGVAIGLFTTLAPALVFGGKAFVIGFIGLFPFWAALVLRALANGPNFLIKTKYSAFCVGWFLIFMFLARVVFDVT